jgi:hypothetical protein
MIWKKLSIKYQVLNKNKNNNLINIIIFYSSAVLYNYNFI